MVDYSDSSCYLSEKKDQTKVDLSSNHKKKTRVFVTGILITNTRKKIETVEHQKIKLFLCMRSGCSSG